MTALDARFFLQFTHGRRGDRFVIGFDFATKTYSPTPTSTRPVSCLETGWGLRHRTNHSIYHNQNRVSSSRVGLPSFHLHSEAQTRGYIVLFSYPRRGIDCQRKARWMREISHVMNTIDTIGRWEGGLDASDWSKPFEPLK